MPVPPPEWSETTGMDPNMFEQGVFNPEGVYGQGKMKMVGLSPSMSGGYAPGDPGQYGMQLGGLGGPLFEGKKGLMQCDIDPSTGQYRKGAGGQNRCWYVPVTAGSGFTRGMGGSWVRPGTDIVHSAPLAYRHPIEQFSQSWALKYPVSGIAQRNNNFFGTSLLGRNMIFQAKNHLFQRYKAGTDKYGSVGLIGLGSIPLLVTVAFFAWRVGLNKKLIKKDKPGLLSYIFHWDLWPIWGLKYKGSD